MLSLKLLGSSCLFFFFISETTSVKEGERSWQPNTFFFALWTEIICLLFYSWQQKLDHKVSNMHINGLKGQIGVLLSLCPVVYVSFPLCLLLFAHRPCSWKKAGLVFRLFVRKTICRPFSVAVLRNGFERLQNHRSQIIHLS